MQTVQSTKKTSFQKRIIAVVFAIILWFVWWFTSQALFIINIPVLTNFLTHGVTATQSFINITLFLLVPMFFAFVLYHKYVRDYQFLRANKYVWLLYIIPLILFIRLLTLHDVFGVPSWIYGLGMIVSASVQDIGTFGFLQTYVEKKVYRSVAAVIVAVSFFIAHFQYGLAYAALFYIAGFFIFAFLRYKTRSLYATNVLHLSFLLLV